ncbi:hypothetical protein [Clostridium intestinale]|nr:hypothetical protein [Clostridium intestinale]
MVDYRIMDKKITDVTLDCSFLIPFDAITIKVYIKYQSICRRNVDEKS